MATTTASVSDPSKKEPQDVLILKKFIQEYREFLNHLQFWYIRSEFDVSLGQLGKLPIFKRFEHYVVGRTESKMISQMQMEPSIFGSGIIQGESNDPDSL